MVYVSPSIYEFLARGSKGKLIHEGGLKKGDFGTRDLFDRGMETKIYHES